MRFQNIIKTVAAVGALALASAAQAVTYDLNNGGSAFSGLSSWGTVTLDDIATDQVRVTVDLADNYVFVDTGSHEYFSFNLGGLGITSGNLTALSFLDPISSSATLGLSPGANSPFSSFQYAIVCSGTCNGNNTTGNGLTFTLTKSGLSSGSFSLLSTGPGTAAYFAADIFGASGKGGNTTGVVGSTGQVTVPEPGTLGLLGLGLAAVGFARRRKLV